MYPSSQPNQAQQVQAYSTPGAPPVNGIASRIEALQNTVASTAQLVYSVSSALGIASPETTEKTQGLSSLAEVITTLSNRLAGANSELQSILQHLNS